MEYKDKKSCLYAQVKSIIAVSDIAAIDCGENLGRVLHSGPFPSL